MKTLESRFSPKSALMIARRNLRVGVAVIGLEVPHAHVHLVPINKLSDLDFTKKRVELTPEEFQELADKISANL